MISNMISNTRYGVIHDIIYVRCNIIDSSVISHKIYDIIIKIVISYMTSYMISDTRSMI